MQNVLYLSQQLLPPPVMLLLEDISFSPNAFSLLSLCSGSACAVLQWTSWGEK